MKKQQFLKVSIAVMALGTLLTTGCQKERGLSPSNVSQNPETPASFQAQTSDDTSFNHLGNQWKHSQDHLAEVDGIDSSNAYAYDQLKDQLEDSLSGNHFPDLAETEEEFDDFVADELPSKQAFADTSLAYFTDYLEVNTNFSSEAGDWINELESHYASYSGHDELNSNIGELEDDLAADSSIGEAEKAALFGAFAIARHSLSYWYRAQNNTVHPWSSHFGDGINPNAEEALMLNLSFSSAITYGVVYHQALENDYAEEARHSAGTLQASYLPRPVIVDNISS